MQEYLYNLASDKISGIFPSIFNFFLLLLSFLYGLAIRIILFLYKTKVLKIYHFNCKIISIGNLTLGGTGKTPLVEIIARHLVKKGLKVVILSRGYKKGFSPQKADEASMLSENLDGVPVLVGRSRIENVKISIRDYNAQVILLDDGFQHWRLHRDLDIVVIDCTNPFGNRRLIPRGILREPLSSLKRADIFVLSKVDFAQDNLNRIKSLIKDINPSSLIIETTHIPALLYEIKSRQVIDLSKIEDKDVCLLSGIADPRTFEKMIFNLGLKPELRFYFLDHYQYKKNDLENIVRSCGENKINTIITTEKDIYRIKAINFDIPKGILFLVLKIAIKFIKDEEIFFKRLYSVCNC
jgi:tetraacyldisaccharide 4'-kinase